MGLGPIPWDAIVRYLEYHQIPDELHETFIVSITAMDGAYLAWTDKEGKKQSGDTQGKTTQRRKR